MADHGRSDQPESGSTPTNGPVRLPLNRLRHPNDPHRQKIDAERVGALADDIARNGLLQAIGVRGPMPDDTYEVIFGDRRTYAHELLKRSHIDARVWPADTDPLTIRASENVFHEPLSPVEEGKIAARYREQGMELSNIARVMGHAVPWVEGRLALIEYPAELQHAVEHEQITLGVAAMLARIDHPGVRQHYLTEAIRTGANTRSVAVWLAHWNADGSRMAANHEAIEYIVANRDQYVLKVACEGCQQEVPLLNTRTFRFCQSCIATIFSQQGA